MCTKDSASNDLAEHKYPIQSSPVQEDLIGRMKKLLLLIVALVQKMKASFPRITSFNLGKSSSSRSA